jgi:hypothetical protein
MNNSATTPRFPIGELVGKLRTLPVSAFDQIDRVRSLLAEMPVAEPSLARYLTWDRQHYTRNLIDKTDLYELVAVCWEIGQSSSVHNHRDQNCWMAAPVGKLMVENFHVEFQDVEAGNCRLLASNTVELTITNPCAVDPREPVQSARGESARGYAARLLPALRHLRRLFARARLVRKHKASLQYNFWKTSDSITIARDRKICGRTRLSADKKNRTG